MISGFIRYVGPLRALLTAATVLIIACAPFADGRVHEGWKFGTGVIAPTLMTMLAFTLPLDITMARVFMADTAGVERRRYRHIIWMEAILLVILVAAWTPFMISIAR